MKSDFLHKLDLKLIKSSLLAIFCILVPLYSCDADLDGPQSLVGPGVGKVCLAVIVVVVEQGPDVRLLVGRLWIRGGHPVSVVAKDEIIDQDKERNGIKTKSHLYASSATLVAILIETSLILSRFGYRRPTAKSS